MANIKLDINKPLGLSLNKEQAILLLKGLEGLPASDKQNILYKNLKRDLDKIVVIWDRRIKNEKILKEQRRLNYEKKRATRST